MKHIFQHQVRGYELDSFGHVNNAVYLNLFEQARWVLFKDILLYEYILQKKYSVVITETYVKYIRELLLFDEIEINTEMTDQFPLILFKQDIFNKTRNQLSTIASIKGLILDSEKKPVKIDSGFFNPL